MPTPAGIPVMPCPAAPPFFIASISGDLLNPHRRVRWYRSLTGFADFERFSLGGLTSQSAGHFAPRQFFDGTVAVVVRVTDPGTGRAAFTLESTEGHGECPCWRLHALQSPAAGTPACGGRRLRHPLPGDLLDARTPPARSSPPTCHGCHDRHAEDRDPAVGADPESERSSRRSSARSNVRRNSPISRGSAVKIGEGGARSPRPGLRRGLPCDVTSPPAPAGRKLLARARPAPRQTRLPRRRQRVTEGSALQMEQPAHDPRRRGASWRIANDGRASPARLPAVPAARRLPAPRYSSARATRPASRRCAVSGTSTCRAARARRITVRGRHMWSPSATDRLCRGDGSFLLVDARLIDGRMDATHAGIGAFERAGPQRPARRTCLPTPAHRAAAPPSRGARGRSCGPRTAAAWNARPDNQRTRPGYFRRPADRPGNGRQPAEHQRLRTLVVPRSAGAPRYCCADGDRPVPAVHIEENLRRGRCNGRLRTIRTVWRVAEPPAISHALVRRARSGGTPSRTLRQITWKEHHDRRGRS